MATVYKYNYNFNGDTYADVFCITEERAQQLCDKFFELTTAWLDDDSGDTDSSLVLFSRFIEACTTEREERFAILQFGRYVAKMLE